MLMKKTSLHQLRLILRGHSAGSHPAAVHHISATSTAHFIFGKVLSERGRLRYFVFINDEQLNTANDCGFLWKWTSKVMPLGLRTRERVFDIFPVQPHWLKELWPRLQARVGGGGWRGEKKKRTPPQMLRVWTDAPVIQDCPISVRLEWNSHWVAQITIFIIHPEGTVLRTWHGVF